MTETLKDLCKERLLEQAAERTDEGVALVASYLKHVLFAGEFVPVADIAFLAHAHVGNQDKFSVTIYADETKTAAVSARLGYFVDEHKRVTAGSPGPGETIGQLWVASRCPGREFDCVIDAMLAETGWALEDLDETPEPPSRPQKRMVRPSIIASLIGRRVKDVARIAGCVAIVTDDGLVLDFESDAIAIRCFCGSPVEVDRPGSYPHLYCPPCGVGWDSVTRFLEWKDGGGKAVDFVQGGPPAVAEKPAMPALLGAAERLCIDLGPTNDQTTPLWSLLDRFRCTCGAFPTEGSIHGHWCMLCCGYEWDCWEDFFAWKEGQGDKDAKA